MIFKFVNEEKDCQINKNLTIYPIKHPFQDLQDINNNIEIFTDDYHELATSTHLVFINDIVVDDWLKQYLLPLYRQIDNIFVENHVNMDVNEDFQHNFTQLQNQLLMLNLPINFKQNFELNLSLLKYLKLDGLSLNAFVRQSVEAYVHQFKEDFDGNPDKPYFGKELRHATWYSEFMRNIIIGHAIETCYANRFKKPITSLDKIYEIASNNIGPSYPNNHYFRMIEQYGNNNITRDQVLTQLYKYSNLVQRLGGTPSIGVLVYWKMNIEDVPEDFEIPKNKLNEKLGTHDTLNGSFNFGNLTFYEWLSFFDNEDSALNDLYHDVTEDKSFDKTKQEPFMFIDDLCEYLAAPSRNAALEAREVAVGAYDTFRDDIHHPYKGFEEE